MTTIQPILFPTHGLSFGVKDNGVPALLFGKLPLTTPTKLLISGVTKDSTGAILGSCDVHLFRNSDDLLLEIVVSDAVTGAYSFSAVGLSETYYIVAYKVGSPDVSGTTRNDLVGV